MFLIRLVTRQKDEGYFRAFDGKCNIKDQRERYISVLVKGKTVLLILIFLDTRIEQIFLISLTFSLQLFDGRDPRNCR